MVGETKTNIFVRMMKSSSVYAVSGLLRNLVSFVMLPVYTRYLSPADYGIVALIVFVISLIEITLCARMWQAQQKFYYDEEADIKRKGVTSTIFFITVTLSFFVTILGIAYSDNISMLLYKNNELSTVVALFLVLVSTQAIEAVGLTYIRIKNNTSLYFYLSLAKLIVQVGANVYCIVVLELGVLGMATATAFSSVLFAGFVFYYMYKEVGVTIDLNKGWAMLVFSAPLWLSGLVSLYIGSSNRYIMNIFSSLEDIGLYSLAERLAAIIGALIFSPFFSYWSAERFRLKDRADFDVIHRDIFTGVYIVLIACGLGISMYSQVIIEILAEKRFYEAINAVPYLVAAHIFYSLAEFYQFSFLHKDKTMFVGRIMNMTAIATTVLNFMLIPVYGFVGAAIALMGSYLVVLLLSRYMAAPIYDMKLPLMKFFASFLISVIGFVGSKYSVLDPFSLFGFLGVGLWWVVTMAAIVMVNVDGRQIKLMSGVVRERFIGGVSER